MSASSRPHRFFSLPQHWVVLPLDLGSDKKTSVQFTRENWFLMALKIAADQRVVTLSWKDQNEQTQSFYGFFHEINFNFISQGEIIDVFTGAKLEFDIDDKWREVLSYSVTHCSDNLPQIIAGAGNLWKKEYAHNSLEEHVAMLSYSLYLADKSPDSVVLACLECFAELATPAGQALVKHIVATIGQHFINMDFSEIEAPVFFLDNIFKTRKYIDLQAEFFNRFNENKSLFVDENTHKYQYSMRG